MKKVADAYGNIIEGLYRNDDGSLSINNGMAYQKSKLQHDKLAALTDQVSTLQEQMRQILEKLNG